MSVSIARIALAASLAAFALPAQARTMEDQYLRARPSETDVPELDDEEPIEAFDDDSDEPDEESADVPACSPRAEPAFTIEGKEPLADNYRPSLLSTDKDSVTIELAVLVAKSRSSFTEPMQLTADVLVGATRVSRLVQTFEAASVAEAGPTFAFFKAVAPVIDKEGEIKVEVRRAKADGSESSLLFTRIVTYDL